LTKELSWKEILEAQQQDFIQRLKYSLSHHDTREEELVTLSCLEANQYGTVSYHSESINIEFDEEKEEEIHNFCRELVYKFYEEYGPDEYVSYKIGKIGEEAVKIYLGDLVTEVDYTLYESGDSGTDFWLKSNRNIGIQVKTKVLSRITDKDIFRYEVNDCFDWEIDLYISQPERVGDLNWSINEREIAKNKVLICVVFLNFVEADQIRGSSYKCIIAGFNPLEKMNNTQDFKIKDLLYSGGIRPYLQSLIKNLPS